MIYAFLYALPAVDLSSEELETTSSTLTPSAHGARRGSFLSHEVNIPTNVNIATSPKTRFFVFFTIYVWVCEVRRTVLCSVICYSVDRNPRAGDIIWFPANAEDSQKKSSV